MAPSASVTTEAAASAPTRLPGSVVETAPVKASLSGFDPGTLISDDLFYDGNAMSSAEIQSFLDSKIGSCQNGKCLNVLNAGISSRAAKYSTSTGNLICNAVQGGTMRVSELIYRMQVACGISAKVILVTLQKEQGLTTSKAPSDWNLTAAMGQACPDTAPCDPAYAGVGPQILAGVTQLKTYKAARFGKQPGTQYIQYNPNANCGGTTLNVTNYATAALYNYTPYQPNSAALAAGWGLGDGCSSYGNRNFYNYYTDWFGSASTVGNPFGYVDEVQALVGGVRLRGWAADPDTSAPVQVHFYVGSQGNVALAADERADIGLAYPNLGARHGFDVRLSVAPGSNERVCAYAINSAGRGANTLISCTYVTALSGSPVGYLDSVSAAEGGLTVRGWGVDPDTLDPLKLRVTVDSTVSTMPANANRSDLSAVLLSHGTNRGFDKKIDVTPGVHRVCVTAINVGSGNDMDLGCQTVTVAAIPERGRLPIGSIDSVTVEAGVLNVRGWALDPDSAGPIAVHIYVNGSGTAVSADDSRPDVGAAFGSYGSDHGFSWRTDLPLGVSNVCVYAINSAGDNPLLGCRTVEVTAYDPTGYLDSAEVVPAGIRVRGWVIDKDALGSAVEVHVYVGRAGSRIVADSARIDVGLAYPAAGNQHGFDAIVSAVPGERQICAYAINIPAGENKLLGCKLAEVS